MNYVSNQVRQYYKTLYYKYTHILQDYTIIHPIYIEFLSLDVSPTDKGAARPETTSRFGNYYTYSLDRDVT